MINPVNDGHIAKTIAHFKGMRTADEATSVCITFVAAVAASGSRDVMCSREGDTSDAVPRRGGRSSNGCHGDDDRERHRRTRSSFDKEQLRLMTSYFALNQNPDTNDLKQLSIRTGVSKRVLQVRGLIQQVRLNNRVSIAVQRVLQVRGFQREAAQCIR
jgi:Homeodomain